MSYQALVAEMGQRRERDAKGLEQRLEGALQHGHESRHT